MDTPNPKLTKTNAQLLVCPKLACGVVGVRGALRSLRGPRARQGTEPLIRSDWQLKLLAQPLPFAKNVISCELKFTGGGDAPPPRGPGLLEIGGRYDSFSTL